jgi:nitrite reductase (NO-forming)
MSKTEKLELGVQIYEKKCMSCHTPTGKGIPNVYPPLAKSDYLVNHLEDAIQIVMYGKSGNIVVNGKNYNNIMTNLHLQDHEIASVLTYVLNNWDNSGEEISIQKVKEIRSKNPIK